MQYTRTVSCFSILLAACSATAQLPIYEPFDYSPGRLEVVSSGLWDLDQGGLGIVHQIVDSPADNGSSLDYPGLLASSGNRLRSAFDNDNRGLITQSFPNVTTDGTTLYASFLLQVESEPQPFGLNFFTIRNITGSGPAASTATACSIYAGPGTTSDTFKLGLTHGTTGTLTTAPGDYDNGETLLIVVGYRLSSGSNNDTSFLWINPTPGTSSPPTPTLTASSSSQSDVEPNRVGFTTGIGTAGVNQVDELRVSTNWEDVVPEGLLAAPTWESYQ